MDGGKRVAGQCPARVAFAFGLTGAALPYDQFVQLFLNTPWAHAARVSERADAVRIAVDDLPLPAEWIDLLSDDDEERAAWRQREFRRSVRDG